MVLEKKTLKSFQYFAIISPLKRVWPFIWINLNPLHPRILCVKFGRSWISSSREEDLLKFSMYFCYFVIITPWKRAWPFIWTNLNPLHQRIQHVFSKIWLKFAQGSGEEDKKCEKFTDRRTDKRQSAKLTWAIRSGELIKHSNYCLNLNSSSSWSVSGCINH